MKTRGVKVPCSISFTVSAYLRFFSSSCSLYMLESSKSLYVSALGKKSLTSKKGRSLLFPKSSSMYVKACIYSFICLAIHWRSLGAEVRFLHHYRLNSKAQPPNSGIYHGVESSTFADHCVFNRVLFTTQTFRWNIAKRPVIAYS